MRRRLTLALLASAVLSGLVVGCSNGSDETAATVPGRTLTLYSSLPLSGPSAQLARAVLAGQREALADAGGRAGGYRVRLIALDSSRPEDVKHWDPPEVEDNAKRAADDPTTIAYLGELDFGASAISLPVTSSAGILQVSPGDGLTSLTRVPPARPRATPERLYPGGAPNLLRLVPNDLLQARALVRWARDAGARRVFIVDDPGLYGDELAAQTAFTARRAGMFVLGPEHVPDPDGAVDLARSIVSERPDAVLYTGDIEQGTAPFLDAFNALAPRTPVFASSAVTQAPAGLGADGRGRLQGLKPALPASDYPRAGRRILRELSRRGRAPIPTEALYGYESVALVLDAIKAVGSEPLRRAAVRRAALRPRRRRSILGVYEIRPRGEVSSRRFGRYEIRDGRLASPEARPSRDRDS